MEDEDFEVTAEMLIHDDVDDESTLDEEEAEEDQDDQEIADLQKESEIPLEQLLAMYGYGVPTEEAGDDGGEEEGVESAEEEGDWVESEEAKGNSPPTTTSQTSTNPSSPPSPPPSSSSHHNIIETSRKKSSKSISVDSKQPTVGSSDFEPDLIQDIVEDHDILAEEVEIGEHPADFPGSPLSSSVLGKHPRSEGEGEGPGDDTVYRDVMLSSRTALEVPHLIDHHITSSDHTHLAPIPEDHLLSLSSIPLQPLPSTTATATAVEESSTTMPATNAINPSSFSSSITNTSSGSSSTSPSTSTSSAVYSQPSTSAGPPHPGHPERRSIRLMAAGERLSLEGYFTSLYEEEDSDESDEEYMPRDVWKREIKVGSNYQAKVPEVKTRSSRLPNSIPNSSRSSSSNARNSSSGHHDNSGNGHPLGELVWNPKETTEEKVVKYLENISEQVSGMDSNGERDNEQALEVLQKCSHDVPKALDLIHEEGLSTGMKPWTEEECRNFEEGLQSLGKDFFNIQRKIPTRTVKEVVEFYYIWKKTERYDAFVQQYGKIGRKRLVYPPGHLSDFMDRYLDLFASDSSDVQYATTSVYAEMKKDNL